MSGNLVISGNNVSTAALGSLSFLNGVRPFVSVIVACRNEAAFIADCLESILANDYPRDRLEVLIVDGRSTDRTREIVQQYAQAHPSIRLVDNPRLTAPYAFNLGVDNSRGDLIIIMGAHSSYAHDYISKCVRYSLQYNAENVGGVIDTLPRTPTLMGNAIVAVLRHRFGVGNSSFRTGNGGPVWVDTVFGGCYRREVFERIGRFNPKLTHSQDIEFNMRLRKAGGRILLVPDITCEYHAWSDLQSFWSHNFRNGLWSILPFAYSEVQPVAFRHLVPLIFLFFLLITACAALVFRPALWLFLAILGAYSVANVAASFDAARRERRPDLLVLLPVAFATLHFGYGLGSLVGVAKLLVRGKFWRKIAGAYRCRAA